MKSPPAQVLVLRTGDSTVFLGPPGAWGMSELGPVAVLDKPVEGINDRLALGSLEALKRDEWQVSRLRSYLAGPALAGYGPADTRAMPQATAQVFYNLRAHLRAHRLRAVVIGNHDRVAGPSAAQRGVAGPAAAQAAASAGPQVAHPTLPGLPVTLPRGGSLPASRPPANVAGWSTLDRLMALLHDTLPLLGPALRAHLEAMTSTEAVAHLLAGMALMAGLQAVPVLGEAADAAFLAMAYAYAGWDGLLALVHLAAAVRVAVEARSEAEIAGAAPGAAEALVTLGGAFLDAVALRMAKRNTSGGGKVVGENSGKQTIKQNRGSNMGRAGSFNSEPVTAPKQAIQKYWPSNGGFLNTPTPQTLDAGYKFSRYGGFINNEGKFQDFGAYIAPADVPYEMRALPPGSDAKPFTTYEVVNPIQDVPTGPAAPAFGQLGLGIQHQLPMTIQDYLDQGDIKVINQTLPTDQ